MPAAKQKNTLTATLWPKNHSQRLVICVGVALLAFIGVVYTLSSQAATSATISLNPTTATVARGGLFTLTIREDSGTSAVNAVKAVVKYPADKIEFVSVDANASGFSIQAEQTAGGGTVSVARGSIEPKTGSQEVVKLTFRMTANGGKSILAFDPATVVVSSETNQNILTSLTGSTITSRRVR